MEFVIKLKLKIILKSMWDTSTRIKLEYKENFNSMLIYVFIKHTKITILSNFRFENEKRLINPLCGKPAMRITQSSNLNNIIDHLCVDINFAGVHNRFRQFNIKSDSDANYM